MWVCVSFAWEVFVEHCGLKTGKNAGTEYWAALAVFLPVMLVISVIPPAAVLR